MAAVEVTEGVGQLEQEQGQDRHQGKPGTPASWQATGTVNGRPWGMSGAGSCPAVIRAPRGAMDVVVTDNGARVFPRILEG